MNSDRHNFFSNNEVDRLPLNHSLPRADPEHASLQDQSCNATPVHFRGHSRPRRVPQLIALDEPPTDSAENRLQKLIALGYARYRSLQSYKDRLTPEKRRAHDQMAARLRKTLVEAGKSEQQANQEEVVVVSPDLLLEGQATPHAFTVQKGSVYFATLGELPGTMKVEEAKQFLLIETANALTTWFVVNGALDAAKAREFVATFALRLYAATEDSIAPSSKNRR